MVNAGTPDDLNLWLRAKNFFLSLSFDCHFINVYMCLFGNVRISNAIHVRVYDAVFVFVCVLIVSEFALCSFFIGSTSVQ